MIEEGTAMDRIARGMSQAGRHPQECCTRQEGLVQRMSHSFKGIAAKIRHFLTGKGESRTAAAR
jgi:hypothetical protein